MVGFDGRERTTKVNDGLGCCDKGGREGRREREEGKEKRGKRREVMKKGEGARWNYERDSQTKSVDDVLFFFGWCWMVLWEGGCWRVKNPFLRIFVVVVVVVCRCCRMEPKEYLSI